MVEIGGTLFFQMLNFVVLLVIIRLFMYKPLMRIIDERNAKIVKSQDDAESALAEAQNLKESYEAKLREIRQEASKIIADHLDEGKKIKYGLIQEGKAEARRTLDNATRDIAREQDKAMETLKGQVSDLAVRMAGKLLSESIDTTSGAKIIATLTEKVGKINAS